MAAASAIMARREGISVQVDLDVIRVARIVAAYEDKTLVELLSETLRPIMQQKLSEHQAKSEHKTKRRSD